MTEVRAGAAAAGRWVAASEAMEVTAASVEPMATAERTAATAVLAAEAGIWAVVAGKVVPRTHPG